MLPERHNLLIVGSVHFIKGAAYAFVSGSRNMRRIGEHTDAIQNNINQPIGALHLWGGVEQFNHRIHKALSPPLVKTDRGDEQLPTLQIILFLICSILAASMVRP